jgi:hypothetical protein
VALISDETPIEVEKVETIEVVAKQINGLDYYLDTRKNKVYNPKNGSYIGRWDSVRNLLITTIEDSDQEAEGSGNCVYGRCVCGTCG